VLMESFVFLPSWPLVLSPLLWVAILLIAAVVAGEVTQRFLRMPRIVGYVVSGVLLGPKLSSFVDNETISSLHVFGEIAVGLLLFELGQRVDLDWLRRNPALLAISVTEALLTFGAVFGVLFAFEVRPVVAAACAVVAIPASPAVVMTVVKDLRAQGQVTERLLLLTAAGTAYASVALALFLGWVHVEARHDFVAVLTHPFYLLSGATLLAAVIGYGTVRLLRLAGRKPAFQFSVLVAVILASVAMATVLRVPVPLTLLLLGFFARHFDRDRHFVSLRLGETATLFVVVLFALVGAELKLGGWAAALAIIVVRFAAKLLPMLVLARASAISVRKSALTAAAMTPISGLALLMLNDLITVDPGLGAEVGNTMLMVIAIQAFLGPVATHYSLRRAGDATEED
jgi:Kef-type K+ transport system membrane component KefB